MNFGTPDNPDEIGPQVRGKMSADVNATCSTNYVILKIHASKLPRHLTIMNNPLHGKFIS